MAYASKLGKARISSTFPMAAGICDRCGFVYNFANLKWQYDWRGATLMNLKILVCDTCYDTPQSQLRSIVLPPDPMPIVNARPENYQEDETDYQTVSAPSTIDPNTGIPIPPTTILNTQDGQTLTEQPLGVPVGLEQAAIMPLQGTTQYAVALPILSISSTGTPVVTVTCSAPHNLQNNSQVSVEGAANNAANGFYSITVTTATAFTYNANSFIPAGSLLGNNTLILTANVGVPYNYPQIPQTGI